MKDNSKTNTLLLTVIGVATLLVAVIGATFAYFTAQVGGGESSTTVKMNAGVLKINLLTVILFKLQKDLNQQRLP